MPSIFRGLTSEEAVAMIKNAVKRGEREISFAGKTFNDFNLSRIKIPISLNCEGAIFWDTFNLCNSEFGGSFINLEGATLKNGIALNGLKSKSGYSVYLRGAKIFGEIIELKDTKLHWLSIGGVKYREKYATPVNPIIRLDGSDIKMGISLYHHK